MHAVVASRQHAVVRRCRRVAAGEEPGVVLLDGEHLLGDAIAAGVTIDTVIACNAPDDLLARAERAGAVVHRASRTVLDAASPVRTPAGVVALARWTPMPIVQALQTASPLAIGLVDVQDPGNVGAVMRSADAFGGGAVLTLGQSADPGGWKALRGAMGSTFRVPVARGELAEAVAAARAAGRRVAATVPQHGIAVADLDWRSPTLLLLGREGSGLSGAAIDAADVRVTIPMRRGVNSLNVAVSAAVMLYEASRTPAAAKPDRRR